MRFLIAWMVSLGMWAAIIVVMWIMLAFLTWDLGWFLVVLHSDPWGMLRGALLIFGPLSAFTALVWMR